MLINGGDMVQALQDDLTIDGNSTLFNPNVLIRALDRSYTKIKTLFRWPALEDARETSTEANQQYYAYPSDWRPNSIWKLEVDGTDYGDPMSFKDFLAEIENDNPSGIINKWANNDLKYFIDPTPTTNGNNNISVWGQMVGAGIVDNGSTTIFSNSQPEVNEAIVLEANAILHAKGDEAQLSAQFYSPQAAAIVQQAWGRIKQDKSKEERTSSFFEVPDFFGRLSIDNIRKRIGNF